MPARRENNAAIAIEAALQLHRAGQFKQAESAYRNILINHPRNADALHLLGMLMQQAGDDSQAEEWVRRAISIDSKQAVFYSNLGVILAGMGKLQQAIEAYEVACTLSPDSPETLNNLGVALHCSGDPTRATDCFKRAFLLTPDYVDAANNLVQLLHLQPETAVANHALGDLLLEAGRPKEAIPRYRKSLELAPDSAETHNNLGNALHAIGGEAQALCCYQQALRIAPAFPQAWNNLANVLEEAGKTAEAIAAYQQAIELRPQSPELLSNLGNVLRDAGEWDAAMDCYRKALAIDPQHPSTHNNIGNFYSHRGEWSAAIDAYETAMLFRPDYADAINNRGTALEELGRRDEAMACYQKAFSLDTKLVSPPWNIALLQLLRGDYENGWPGYENRWLQKKQRRTWRKFDQPMLSALPTKGTRVLLHAEQGFGDAIQFCRYAPLLAALGAPVILECPRPLVQLFSSLAGVHEIIARDDALPDFDQHCPLMSLPGLFRTTLQTIPATPYLSADGSKWKKRFEKEPPAFRVGLVWAGQSTHQKDRHRSIPLAAFADLSQISGVRFYSLQVGEAAAQLPSAGLRIVDWTSELHDFADTAALITQLDLVITVDTAVCHVSGALGKPVWILLAFQPDWRWLLDRYDSPWYPSARLFRQQQPDDWSTPLKHLYDALFTHPARVG